MIDANKAHEVTDGLIVNDENNGDLIEGPFYTGGPSSPVGLDLPAKTFYVQNTASGTTIWKKFNTGVNDWRQLSAQDIPFDPTNAQNEIATDMQQLAENQANRHFGKDHFSKTKIGVELTTGITFVTYDTMNFTVNELTGTNNYRVGLFIVWNHDSASNDFIARTLLDGVPGAEVFRQEPKDPGSDQRNWNYFSVDSPDLSNGAHTLEIQYTSGKVGVASTMHRSYMEIWRLA